MKNLYFLVVVGCMVLSQAHADNAYPFARAKGPNEGRALSTFWEKSQTRHAFVDAFSEPKMTLVIDGSGTAHIVESAANTRIEKNQTVSVYLDLHTPVVAD